MPNPIDLCTLSDVRSYLNAPKAGVSLTLVTTPGAGYTTIAITAIPVDGNGTGATFTGVLSGGALVAILITAAGHDYTANPTLLIVGDGTGAAGTAFIGDNVNLASLITKASAFFLNNSNRADYGILPFVSAERRNGFGAQQICPKNFPIISVQSVLVNGHVIPPSPDGVAPGWVNDRLTIYLIGYSFSRGFQNITLNYTAGWAAIPFDITQAVAELTGQKYRRSQHIDQDSQRTTDGQIVSFSKKDIPPEVQDVIDQYSIKAQIE